jgi:NAD-dependent SIR2 family protein deacetylase
MRFLESGADIPNDLIRAVNDGAATFLCGAGVSFAAGLPSFKELTEWVYEKLGESWVGRPIRAKMSGKKREHGRYIP